MPEPNSTVLEADPDILKQYGTGHARTFTKIYLNLVDMIWKMLPPLRNHLTSERRQKNTIRLSHQKTIVISINHTGYQQSVFISFYFNTKAPCSNWTGCQYYPVL